jgi:hypothetical protein
LGLCRLSGLLAGQVDLAVAVVAGAYEANHLGLDCESLTVAGDVAESETGQFGLGVKPSRPGETVSKIMTLCQLPRRS